MLYLGYCNTRMTDGAGAQIQRFLGIYSISRLLGCGYLHFGLSRIGYQGLQALEQKQEIQQLAESYNFLISLESDGSMDIDAFADQVFVVDKPSQSMIMEFKDRSKAIDRDILLLLVLPYAVSDESPSCYAAVYGLIGLEALRRLQAAFPVLETGIFDMNLTDEIVVGMHVRRGELFAVESYRMLPNSYYIAVATQLVSLLTRAGKKFRIDLYTEAPVTTFDLRYESHGLGNRNTEPVTMSKDQLRLWEFDVIPAINFRVNEHQLSTLYNLANCDILIGSRSSYSYVAGIAGNVRCALFPPFWHALLPHWIETSVESGDFDHDLVSQRLFDSLSASQR